LKRLLTGMAASPWNTRRLRDPVRRASDAGTVELIRRFGVEVASSGDLVQRFYAVWHDAEIAAHRAAADKLHRIKDRAFDGRREPHARPGADHGIRHPATDGGMVRRRGPRQRRRAKRLAGENAGNPHYLPTATRRPGNSRRRPRPARSLGASWTGRARCLRTSRGWGTPEGRFRSGWRGHFAAVRDARDCRESGSFRAASVPIGTCAGGKSIVCRLQS